MEEHRKNFLRQLEECVRNGDREGLKNLESLFPDLMRKYKEVATGHVPGEPMGQRDNSRFLDLLNSPGKPQGE